ncbi:10703_t:CDS:2 [Entrophospora sp. SA101]|nr:10703_t:CDS:2 [Entrophospora sp. SA101]
MNNEEDAKREVIDSGLHYIVHLERVLEIILMLLMEKVQSKANSTAAVVEAVYNYLDVFLYAVKILDLS